VRSRSLMNFSIAKVKINNKNFGGKVVFDAEIINKFHKNKGFF
jgi:hypothetical protein